MTLKKVFDFKNLKFMRNMAYTLTVKLQMFYCTMYYIKYHAIFNILLGAKIQT